MNISRNNQKIVVWQRLDNPTLPLIRRQKMNSAKFAKFAVSTLVIGTSMAAFGPASQQARAVAALDQSTIAAQAERFATEASAILASNKGNKAKAFNRAERAVALMPNNASYRSLLGRAYVAAGRFTSAETSFADALALEPGNGKYALNLALMKIARGDSSTAMSLLEEHRPLIALADYGLALALAGDIVGAITTLQEAARSPDANAKTRQNLGLAYALGGRWIEARVVASQDLSPDMVDARMGEWALMASPRAAWDQVAGLLRVTPVADLGQPAQLALVRPAGQALAQASSQNSTTVVSSIAPSPDAVVAPETPAAVFETPVANVKAVEPVYEAPVAASAVSIALDEPKPYVPPVAAAPLVKAAPSPFKQAVVQRAAQSAALQKAAFVPVIHRGVRSGQFVVQLGAYSKMSQAELAWERAANKVGELRNYDPTSARVKVRGNALLRLAVSGFVTREAASQVCTQVKRSGGNCFVRSISGDAPMQFVSRGGSTRIAARR
jgi:Flp pilus assembly protein TadD